MLIGYARTSTGEQVAGFEAQIRDLEALAGGSDRIKIFREQISSVAKERPQLEALIDFCREGDEIVVTKLDRLARSVPHFRPPPPRPLGFSPKRKISVILT